MIDYFNPEFLKNNLVDREKFEFDLSEITIERKIENNRVNKYILIKTDNHEDKYVESVRIYEFEDFKEMFEQNNFMIKKVFGDYSGNPLGKDSPRMIIFSQKK